MSDAVNPFSINVSDEILEDLSTRLANTRWPEAEPVGDWSQGAPLAWIQEVAPTGKTRTTGALGKRRSTGSTTSPRPSMGSTSTLFTNAHRMKTRYRSS